MNFLTNAVKCTQEGFIKMGYSIENEGIRFYVQDSGVGIPIEVQDRVFGRFQKLNEFAQGTGLGFGHFRAIIEGEEERSGSLPSPVSVPLFGHGFLVLQIHRGLTWPKKTKKYPDRRFPFRHFLH